MSGIPTHMKGDRKWGVTHKLALGKTYMRVWAFKHKCLIAYM